MRKKIFATLMSVAMVASFMPSIAFAANTNSGHAFYKYDTDYTIVNGKVVAKKPNNQKTIEKYVEVVTSPTCTTAGSVVSKCHIALPEGVECDETITEEIPAGHSFARVNMTIDEFAAQEVAQKTLTEAEAKAWVKAQKGKCHVDANRCSNCGEVAAIGNNTDDSKVKDHAYTGDKTCASKVQCSFAGCTAKIDTPAEKLDKTGGGQPNHDVTGVTDTEKTVACGGITTTGKVCKKCGEFVANGASTGTAKCKEFVGDLDSVKKSIDGTKVFYNGKKIADISGTTVTTVDGYYYDTNRDVFVKADTKTADNKFGYTCKKCGYVQALDNKTFAETCAHAWTKVTVDATCTTAAQEYMVCSECGKYKKVKDADDVVGTTDKIAATATVEGSKPLKHALEVKTVAGDCHDTAKYVVKCTRKGCNAKVEVTPADFKTLAKGDSLFVDPSKAALSADTVNVAGSAELKYLSDSTTDNHKFTKKVTVKKATCTNNEIVAYVCDTCGKFNIHTATIVPGTKLAHEIVTVEEPATCEKTAAKYEICKNCDYRKDLVKAKAIPGGKCLEDSWKVIKPATVFEEGIKAVACSKCGNVKDGAMKAPIAKKTVAKATVTLKAGKNSFTVKASAANATGYKVVYKRAGKKAITKVVDAENLSKTYKKLAKGKKYTVKVTAFASNGTETVYGATTTKTVKTK